VRELARRVIPPATTVEVEGDARRERERVRAAVADLVGPIPPLDGAPPRTLEPGVVGGQSVERVVLEARLDVPLPALVFTPENPMGDEASHEGQRPSVVLLDDRGKGAESGDGGLGPALACEGMLVLAVDLRGWGETVWVNDTFAWSPDRRSPLSADTMLANVGLMLGRWSITQRVQDVLGVLRYLRARPDVDPQRIVLVGRGGGAIVALHTAAIEGGIAGVAALESLVSYRAIVEAPRHVHPVSDFIPNVLLHYDLPELAAALAPAPVLIAAPEDAMGSPLPVGDAEAAYAQARRTARMLGGDVDVYASAVNGVGGAREYLMRWVRSVVAGTVAPTLTLPRWGRE
jgi:dienelactone hydrolase